MGGTGSGETNHKNTKEKRKWKQNPGRWHFSELESNEGHFLFSRCYTHFESIFLSRCLYANQKQYFLKSVLLLQIKTDDEYGVVLTRIADKYFLSHVFLQTQTGKV